MIDERSKLIKNLVHELKTIFPTRKQCARLTEKDLKEMINKVDYDSMIYYLWNRNLKLKFNEIPKKLWFQLLLYFVLYSSVFVDNNIYDAIDDSVIWDLNDDLTKRKVKMIKSCITGMNYSNERDNIVNLYLSNLINYAKSDKPNF